ncbi:MAG: GerMN domain-containing protein [Bacillota bacterium]
MKRQKWNEEQLEQLEQLLKQLPSVKDKQTAEEIYQSIQFKQLKNKTSKTWIAPTIATVAALFIFAMISPFLFQNINPNEESAMDIASSSEQDAKMEIYSTNDSEIAEAKLAQESTREQSTLDKKAITSKGQETFVTSASEAEATITVGFTDGNAQNIIPISVDINKNQNKIEQIDEIIPEINTEELGLIGYELSNTEFSDKGNTEEIKIEYKGEPKLLGANEGLYQKAIVETFRWLNFKKARLYTNDKEGIEFSHLGLKTELDLKQESKKAYFLYQYDKQTSKLLVPSQDQYASIDKAIEAMQQGLPDQNLKPTIMNNIVSIGIKENGEQLEVEFNQDTVFENREPTIIMLESILLTAKEFGYKTVQFREMNIDKIGVMDVTKPIEVPFSPNPIDAN